MRRSFLKYLTALLMFGFNGIVASVINRSSHEIVLLRTMIGSLFLAAVFFLTGNRLTFFRHRRAALYLLCSGMAMGASWLFLFEAYQQIGVGIASLLYYCGPVFVMALSPVLFRERLTCHKIFGFFAVFGGILLINGLGRNDLHNGVGFFYGMMSAVMYAVMVVFNKKADSILGFENSFLQLLISFLTVMVFVLLRGVSVQPISGAEWLPVLILGVVNTGIGCWFYFSAIGDLPVQTVAVCGYLEPLSAVVCSGWILGETMSCCQLGGAILILGGAAFCELYRPHRKSP